MSTHENNESKNHLKDIAEARASLPAWPVRIRAKLVVDDDVVPTGGKRLHLVRHGEGYHNVWGANWKKGGKKGNPYVQEECPIDAMLTPLGIQQAQENQHRCRALLGAGLELVVVSPMRRAIQTALHAFGEECNEKVNMQIPFVASEACREQCGLHRCDMMQPLATAKAEFPIVDFSNLSGYEHHDALWEGCNGHNMRENRESVMARAYELMLWLRSRPESHIIIFSHSSYLLTLLNGVLEVEEPQAASWFRTGELRSFAVTFSDDRGVEEERKEEKKAI